MVSVGDKIKVEKIETADKKEVVFDEVLLVVDDKEEVKIGAPFIEGAKVKAKILAQDKAKKIIVFKYKAKKRSHKKIGHRQPYTEVEITGISLSTS